MYTCLHNDLIVIFSVSDTRPVIRDPGAGHPRPHPQLHPSHGLRDHVLAILQEEEIRQSH